MQKAKKLLFSASILELILAVVILIFDGFFSANWLSSIEGDLTGRIIITCVLFVLSVALAVDGVLALRYSRASDEILKKCQKARVLMGVAFIVLAVTAYILLCVIVTKKQDIVAIILVFSFLECIAIAILNIKSAVDMNKQEEQKPIATSQVVKPQVVVQKQRDIDGLIQRLNSLAVLRDRGLITEEEFEKFRTEVLNSYKD